MEGSRKVGPSVGLLLAGLMSVLFAADGSSASAGPNKWCEPPEAIRSQLDALDLWGSDCLPGQPCWQSRLDAAKKLLAAYPDDLFVNRTYQDLLRMAGREGPGVVGLVEEYSARARKHPAIGTAYHHLTLFPRSLRWRRSGPLTHLRVATRGGLRAVERLVELTMPG